MLKQLNVRQFAVVEEAEIRFGPGLTVVTGETGAGKSLLVDALALLAGARADAGQVRSGAARAELAAEFDIGALPAARAWLQDQALDDADDCRLRRVIAAEGGSRAWINGRPASLAQLDALAERLLEIHGQHEHQALLQREHQLELLDAFGHLQANLAEVRAQALRWRALDAEIRRLAGDDDRDARIERLRHELDELERWALAPEALAELEQQHRRLAHAERLVSGAAALVDRCDGDADQALGRQLARAQGELARLVELDPGLQDAAELLAGAAIQLGEASELLARYAERQDLDPGRYAEADAHLSHLHELGRKHRQPISALATHARTLRDELDRLDHAGAALQLLAGERAAAAAACRRASATLSSGRAAAAARLGAAVAALMEQLGMAGGRFAVEIEASGDSDPDPQGCERCEFMVSANPGLPLRPLRRVASGGELARIGLALEVAALGHDAIGTMVFDEVDSGIGGAVAEVVGQKLRALGSERQVLCVTHLAQVAAQGHAHLRVLKDSDGGATRTRIETLAAEGRREELARMLGGVEITRETRAHARRMLEQAQQD
ncbi:MAG: DNA repair protein RecN [Xanthomonadaceae bacterium]|nr:DNA repair protein RecN [Xanthomonadaceae bacterium]